MTDRIAKIIDGEPLVLAGVSETGIGAVVVKVLATAASELREVLEAVWGAARAELLSRSAPALRRY